MALKSLDICELGDVELLKQLVHTAGVAAKRRRKGIGTEYKSDQSIVTAADRDTEEFLYDQLRLRYPAYGFAGEEYGRRGPAGDLSWAVDPIDGTTNYVLGLPSWCVSVGLLHCGNPVMGALYAPETDELFWGQLGAGAFCNGEQLTALDSKTLHPEDVVCFNATGLKLIDVQRLPSRIRALGSIAIELAYTAAGRARAAVGTSESILDTAAALVLCREAGCVVGRIGGPAVRIDQFATAEVPPDHFIVGCAQTVSLLSTCLTMR